MYIPPSYEPQADALSDPLEALLAAEDETYEPYHTDSQLLVQCNIESTDLEDRLRGRWDTRPSKVRLITY